jgi:hypothetical protein
MIDTGKKEIGTDKKRSQGEKSKEKIVNYSSNSNLAKEEESMKMRRKVI